MRLTGGDRTANSRRPAFQDRPIGEQATNQPERLRFTEFERKQVEWCPAQSVECEAATPFRIEQITEPSWRLGCRYELRIPRDTIHAVEPGEAEAIQFRQDAFRRFAD